MKTTPLRKVGSITAVLLVAVAAAAALAWFQLRQPEEELPGLTLAPEAAPLIYFDRRSQLDPGMIRLLLPVEQDGLAPLGRRLGRAVTAVFEGEAGEPDRDLVAFTEAWEHENVIEVRIPLVDPADRDRWIECRVGSIRETFRLRPRDLPAPVVGLRQIDFLEDGDGVSIAAVNLSGSVVAIDGIRINGRDVEQPRAIELPAYGSARLWLRDISSTTGNVSVVLSADGRWVEAHEVARTPRFALLDWGEFTGGAHRGTTVAEVAVDVCNIEVERGMPAGSYLADMRELIDEAVAELPADDRRGRPHAFVFLNDGGRPVSHWIYGRLSDFVGVSALDPRLSTADLRDVAFWSRLDREAVEPRHLLVMPGVLRRDAGVGDRLEPRELRRLVLAALSVGPRGLASYWPEDDPLVVTRDDDSGYEPALAEIKAEIEPMLPLLETALPVGWVARRSAGDWVRDRFGTTGIFALWTADDRLILLDLGYRQTAGLTLPVGVRIAERLTGSLALVAVAGDGMLEVRSPHPGSPGFAVFRLAVERARQGSLEWLTY